MVSAVLRPRWSLLGSWASVAGAELGVGGGFLCLVAGRTATDGRFLDVPLQPLKVLKVVWRRAAANPCVRPMDSSSALHTVTPVSALDRGQALAPEDLGGRWQEALPSVACAPAAVSASPTSSLCRGGWPEPSHHPHCLRLRAPAGPSPVSLAIHSVPAATAGLCQRDPCPPDRALVAPRSARLPGIALPLGSLLPSSRLWGAPSARGL